MPPASGTEPLPSVPSALSRAPWPALSSGSRLGLGRLEAFQCRRGPTSSAPLRDTRQCRQAPTSLLLPWNAGLRSQLGPVTRPSDRILMLEPLRLCLAVDAARRVQDQATPPQEIFRETTSGHDHVGVAPGGNWSDRSDHLAHPERARDACAV